MIKRKVLGWMTVAAFGLAGAPEGWAGEAAPPLKVKVVVTMSGTGRPG